MAPPALPFAHSWASTALHLLGPGTTSPILQQGKPRHRSRWYTTEPGKGLLPRHSLGVLTVPPGWASPPFPGWDVRWRGAGRGVRSPSQPGRPPPVLGSSSSFHAPQEPGPCPGLPPNTRKVEQQTCLRPTPEMKEVSPCAWGGVGGWRV